MAHILRIPLHSSTSLHAIYLLSSSHLLTGARATAWCPRIHAEASLSLTWGRAKPGASSYTRKRPSLTGAKAKAWCHLIHAEASLSHGGQGESLVPPSTRLSVCLSSHILASPQSASTRQSSKSAPTTFMAMRTTRTDPNADPAPPPPPPPQHTAFCTRANWSLHEGHCERALQRRSEYAILTSYPQSGGILI